MKEKLVEFNGNTIYKVYIDNQNKIIRVKDYWIFKDILTKAFSILPNFDGKLIFDVTQIPNERPSGKSSAFKDKKDKPRAPQKPKKTWADRDVIKISKQENEPNTTEKLTKSQVNRTLKPLAKKQEKVENAINVLIIELTSLLKKNWKKDQTSAFLTTYKKDNKNNDSNGSNLTKQDPLHVLAVAIYKANTRNLSNFSSSTLLDVEESETYNWVMNGSYAQ